MSDTPRTDALWSDSSVTPDEIADLSRELERRVAELEGLEVWNGQLKEGGRWFEVFVPSERIGENATTLGQAMPGGGKRLSSSPSVHRTAETTRARMVSRNL